MILVRHTKEAWDQNTFFFSFFFFFFIKSSKNYHIEPPGPKLSPLAFCLVVSTFEAVYGVSFNFQVSHGNFDTAAKY